MKLPPPPCAVLAGMADELRNHRWSYQSWMLVSTRWKNYESQLGLWFPISGKIEMCKTTYQGHIISLLLSLMEPINQGFCLIQHFLFLIIDVTFILSMEIAGS